MTVITASNWNSFNKENSKLWTSYIFNLRSIYTSNHRYLRKTDWWMTCTACLVCLVSTGSVHHKKTLENQALVAGTKQSRQAVKADRLQGCQADKAVRLTRRPGRLTRQSGWQGSQADKAIRLTRQSGLQGCQADKAVRPACFVLCLLLASLFFKVDV